MVEQQIFASSDGWEHEGGSLLDFAGADSLGLTRFLSQSYVVDGQAFTRLVDAVAQARRTGSGAPRDEG